MESDELFGVLETVPEFVYQVYGRQGTKSANRLFRKQYEGHQRIVAAFCSLHEAEAYKKETQQKRNEATRGGYYQIHEREYRLKSLAQYDIVPVDVMPAVAVRPS